MSVNVANLVWSIADQLRGVYRPAQYGWVILPMTVLRRMEAATAPHREEINGVVAKLGDPAIAVTVVQSKFGIGYYNTSPWTLSKLTGDPENLAANLESYIAGFSPNVRDVFDRFGFANQIAKLAATNRLFLVVKEFANVDLSPAVVSNADMGGLFEHLIYKFSTASNESPGEHFTPRDAIRLIVDILLEPDDDALAKPGTVRRVYDPTAGTGGMLSITEERVHELNPDARIVLFGQELNGESYAICKADMIGKGQDAGNIALGDTLADDQFAGQTFDYCLSNPPYGGDWKSSHESVERENRLYGFSGRFGAGLPRISDGQMLFLQHLASKMAPSGRAGIVLNGSPLFTGGAGSGESEIRRWLLENDLVDAIIGLPDNMFYNTGIATYVWILDNDKPVERQGSVQLIDARNRFSKMRKNLGSKNKELSAEDRAAIVRAYTAHEDNDHSKIVPTTDFGYRQITVEQPLRLRFDITDQTIEQAMAAKKITKLDQPHQDGLRAALLALVGRSWNDRKSFEKDLLAATRPTGVAQTPATVREVSKSTGVHDDNATICTDAKHKPEPDTDLRDTELVPLDEDVESYFEREVKPYVPDGWIDHSKTKVGYEIPFTRLFYTYQPARPLDQIDADLERVAAEIIRMLQAVES